MKKKFTTLFIIILSLYLIVFKFNTSYTDSIANLSNEEIVQKIYSVCAGHSYKPTCYDEEIPKLLSEISMERVFKIAGIVQVSDVSYSYCHDLGHKLSASEVSKNPREWKEVISRCPRGICSNGCQHGAAQERFRNEVLTQDQLIAAKIELVDVCNLKKDWTGLEKSECIHGLGHLSVYLTGADVDKSLRVCNDINLRREELDLCYDGAFMQIFQPQDPDDISLVEKIKPKTKEETQKFCRQFPDLNKVNACIRQAYPLYFQEIETSDGLIEYCAQSSPGLATEKCQNMLFYVQAQRTNYNVQKLADLCNGMPDKIKGRCFGQIANAIIHGGSHLISQAVAYCSLASDGKKDICLETILEFAPYNLPVGTKVFKQLCESFPSDWQRQCFRKNN
ncbi:hypothetical protein A2818_00905 [Candidatus Nomurabacteria bacterium RIFCSPHIGHO2_01_FULL_40_12]|uniref:Uncharacterized protein n=1 Tax=Candidatus Nomurabacteria bacterium RIFCSPHIGHO2_01_FULL_40_12 TaxID=1801737 RepID=A0A1F6UZI1_9BACT|nr:MAG: hypothetical protein A2818_00905 [Candidatus Nomurabacteria bacterium RIFCSPHIGHO2_01_FULL_40_12]